MASEFSSKCLNLNVSDGRKLWVTLELADDGLRGTSTNKHANAHARALFMHMYSNGVNSSILHMLLVPDIHMPLRWASAAYDQDRASRPLTLRHGAVFARIGKSQQAYDPWKPSSLDYNSQCWSSTAGQ